MTELDQESQARYLELMKLEFDWDSYGSLPLNTLAVHAAQDFQVSLLEAGYQGPRPAIFPSTSGGIILEWLEADYDVTIDFDPCGLENAVQVEWYIYYNDVEDEGVILPDDTGYVDTTFLRDKVIEMFGDVK